MALYRKQIHVSEFYTYVLRNRLLKFDFTMLSVTKMM